MICSFYTFYRNHRSTDPRRLLFQLTYLQILLPVNGNLCIAQLFQRRNDPGLTASCHAFFRSCLSGTDVTCSGHKAKHFRWTQNHKTFAFLRHIILMKQPDRVHGIAYDLVKISKFQRLPQSKFADNWLLLISNLHFLKLFCRNVFLI